MFHLINMMSTVKQICHSISPICYINCPIFRGDWTLFLFQAKSEKYPLWFRTFSIGIILIFNFYYIKLRCQYWRYWTLGQRPQVSRRSSLFNILHPNLSICVQNPAKSPKIKANTMGVGPFINLHPNSRKISQN